MHLIVLKLKHGQKHLFNEFYIPDNGFICHFIYLLPQFYVVENMGGYVSQLI